LVKEKSYGNYKNANSAIAATAHSQQRGRISGTIAEIEGGQIFDELYAEIL